MKFPPCGSEVCYFSRTSVGFVPTSKQSPTPVPASRDLLVIHVPLKYFSHVASVLFCSVTLVLIRKTVVRFAEKMSSIPAEAEKVKLFCSKRSVVHECMHYTSCAPRCRVVLLPDASQATDTASVNRRATTRYSLVAGRGISGIPWDTRRDGTETVLAWKGKEKLCGVHPLPPRQAETALRGVLPLPSRQGEIQVRGVQPLPPRQAERQLRGVRRLPSRQGERQLQGVQRLPPRQAERTARSATPALMAS